MNSGFTEGTVGFGVDVQALWDLLQASGNYEHAWLAKLWQAYLMERMH